jgi:hypothetical protein
MTDKVLSFDQICALEPEIRELYLQAKNLKEKKKAYELWHRKLKPNLTTLVGEHAKHPELRSYQAYATAIDKIMKVLGL